MRSKVLIFLGFFWIIGSPAMAWDYGYKPNRRVDCRFYGENDDPKCDDKKCDDCRKCDDGKKCDDKKCDEDKRCDTGKPCPKDKAYNEKNPPRFCYASATYWVGEYGKIGYIHFGVGCDRQTIYDSDGTFEPQETVADHIRPKTAATPLIELTQKGDLRYVGTYTAKLEIDDGALLDGKCYVVDTEYYPVSSWIF